MRTRVYVDGFNLYYGALEGTPFRWLDPVKLTALLLPRECMIDRLRYFTARVSGKLDPQAPARQQPVTLPEGDHRVLGERPQTVPVGVYPDRRGEREGGGRGTRIPLPDAVIAEFHTMEEKGSDVNLAAHLLDDGWNAKGNFFPRALHVLLRVRGWEEESRLSESNV